MKAVSPELAAAIEAPDRQLAPDRLFVDWDRDGFGAAGSIDDLSGHVTSVSTDGSLQGDYPDDVRIVQGSAARTLTAGLGGGSPTDDAVGTTTWFSPVAPAAADVPLAGKDRRNRPCYHEVGFVTSAGPQYVRDFTGVTTNLPISVGQRQASLTAVDNRGLLRKKLALPALATQWTTPVGDVIAPGLEATWLASYVFAQNGFYASPPPRPGIRMWAPMHGSAQPFIHDALGGLLAAGTESLAIGEDEITQARFVDGPFVAGLSSGTLTSDTFAFMQATAAPGPDLFDSFGRSVGRIEAWVKAPAATTVDTVDPVFILQTADDEGSLWFQVLDNLDGGPQLIVTVGQVVIVTINGPTVSGLLDDAWHFVGLAWDRPAGKWAVAVDSHHFSGTTTPAPPSGSSPGEEWFAYVSCTNGAALAEVQVTAGGATTDPWLVEMDFTPTAVVDRSLNQLAGLVPDSTTVDSAQVLKDLAVAERGTCFFDDDGVGRYRTTAAMVTDAAQNTQVTVTSRDKITDLQIDTGVDRVRNIVTCPWVQVSTSFGTDTDPAYEASSTVVLPGGRVTTLLVDLKGPTFGGTLGIRVSANTAADGTGTNYGTVNLTTTTTATIGPVDVAVTQLTASTARIDLTNNVLSTVFLVDATGASALALTGVYLSADSSVSPAVAQDDASIDEYGEQPITLPASPYRQRLAQAVGVCRQTLHDTASPQPIISNLVIVGDPRLEYFDRFAVQDPEGSRLDGTFWVRSIRPARTGGSYLMTLAAIGTRDVLRWGVGHWGIEAWG